MSSLMVQHEKKPKRPPTYGIRLLASLLTIYVVAYGLAWATWPPWMPAAVRWLTQNQLIPDDPHDQEEEE